MTDALISFFIGGGGDKNIEFKVLESYGTLGRLIEVILEYSDTIIYIIKVGWNSYIGLWKNDEAFVVKFRDGVILPQGKRLN